MEEGEYGIARELRDLAAVDGEVASRPQALTSRDQRLPRTDVTEIHNS